MQKIITDEQKEKMISLSQQGFNNRQIAIELGIKYATLCYWKNRLRSQGIQIYSQVGRPRKGSTPTYITTLAEVKRMEDEEKKQKRKKLFSISVEEVQAMTPEQRKAHFDAIMNP